MKRHIAISYECRPDEPSATAPYEAQIRQAFAELGWTVTQYGGGSSNVHRCHIDIEADDRELDRPTLVAMLKRLGIPIDDIGIHGQLSPED